MWAVREVYENTVVVGYYNSTRLEIYTGSSLEQIIVPRVINVGINIFGLVVPPFKIEPENNPTAHAPPMPRKLIALENERYCVIDLDNHTTKTIIDIRTGLGSYMPRYICKIIDLNVMERRKAKI